MAVRARGATVGSPTSTHSEVARVASGEPGRRSGTSQRAGRAGAASASDAGLEPIGDGAAPARCRCCARPLSRWVLPQCSVAGCRPSGSAAYSRGPGRGQTQLPCQQQTDMAIEACGEKPCIPMSMLRLTSVLRSGRAAMVGGSGLSLVVKPIVRDLARTETLMRRIKLLSQDGTLHRGGSLLSRSGSLRGGAPVLQEVA